ncbi:MAG: hypothetical protein Q8J78_04890 [Moraxellaceae bacterium]|nr:hypothetical protein [Moraxellaceae bacterium]
MPALLAAAVPSPDDLASWISVFMYLGGFVATVIGSALALKKLRERVPAPIAQPLVVQEHPGLVSQDDLDQVHGRIARERREVEGKISDLKKEDLRLREKLDGDLRQINDRIDRVPERTIELLRSTKGLI